MGRKKYSESTLCLKKTCFRTNFFSSNLNYDKRTIEQFTKNDLIGFWAETVSAFRQRAMALKIMHRYILLAKLSELG